MREYAKNLRGELWELRPGPFRIFYYWDEQEQNYVLLNGFRKKSRETPSQEIERAERLMAEHKAQRESKGNAGLSV